MNHRRKASAGIFGVTLFFMLIGAISQSVAPRYADLSAKLGLSPGALGVALFGSTAALFLVGTTFSFGSAERLGNRLSYGVPLILLCLSPILLAIADSGIALFGIEFFRGATTAPLDLAGSALALGLSAQVGRKLLPRFHIGFAFGALAGAGACAFTAHRVEIGTYLFWVAAVSVGLALFIWRFLPAETPVPAETEVPAETPVSEKEGPTAGLSSNRHLWAVAAFGFFAILAQLVGQDWSSVFYRDVLHAAPAQYGYGALALQGGIVLALLIGRVIVERFGARLVAQVGGATFTLAIAVFVLSHSVVVATGALAIAGLGAGNLVWLAIAGVGNHPRYKLWVARVAAAMYVARGASRLMGLLADAISLRAALLVCAVPVGIAVCAMASVLPGRRSGSAPGGGGAIAVTE